MIFLPKKYWEVKKTKYKGLGLFAKKDIPEGVIIGDYLGKILKTEELDLSDYQKEVYLMYYSDEASIFPDLQKPGVHLLNHSCTPNSWLYIYKGHTLFFTLRRIFAGEELTIAYLLSPNDGFCDPCSHKCRCGSPLCVGSMHLSEEKYKKWRKFQEIQEKKTKKEKIKFGSNLKKLSSYPKNIPDNKIYSLFGNTQKPPIILDTKSIPSIKDLRKLIRESGKTIKIPSLKIEILGIEGNKIIF